MTSSKPVTRSDPGCFGNALGDLSPIIEFLGKQVPTKRQVLQLFVHHKFEEGLVNSHSKSKVVAALKAKWFGANVPFKSDKQLCNDVFALYVEAR
jgi:hypothetical protein